MTSALEKTFNSLTRERVSGAAFAQDNSLNDLFPSEVRFAYLSRTGWTTRGFAISFLTLASVALAVALGAFLLGMHL